jgi:hypothetical protein
MRSAIVLNDAADQPTACPPHYWLISRDGDGERWDCRTCGTLNRPKPTRFVPWGERTCTWTREERLLAGIAD